MKIFLSEYIYLIIRRCVGQKLCVAKNGIPPGLSIANLRYIYSELAFSRFPIDSKRFPTKLKKICIFKLPFSEFSD